MSARGTKRTYRDDLLFVRFRGEADMRGDVGLSASVANDPNRHYVTANYCTAKGLFGLDVEVSIF